MMLYDVICVSVRVCFV